MTFGWRNVLAIEGDITYRFSISGVTARHSIGTTGRIRQLFNASWRRTRELVALSFDGGYLKRTGVLTLPVTATVAGEHYVEIPWPTEAIGVYGVRCQMSTGGDWYPLKRASFAGIHDFRNSSTTLGYNPRKGPIAYTSRLLPDGVGSTETAGVVMLAPVPVGGNYSLFFLEGWQDRTADADTIPGMADWIEHAILGTLIKMAQPDGDSAKQVQIWMMERNDIRDQIIARAMQLEASIPLEPRDARGDGYDDAGWRDEL